MYADKRGRWQAGTPRGDGYPIASPSTYVVLNAALRETLADSVGSLQRGTVNGDMPVYSTKPSSNAWLRCFDVSSDELLRAKAAVLHIPKLRDSGLA